MYAYAYMTLTESQIFLKVFQALSEKIDHDNH